MSLATNDTIEIDWDNVPSSVPERFFIAMWCLACITFAVLGNSMVLVSSIKYNAIKLDNISIALIQNIAFADIGYAVYVTTVLVSVIENKWILGDILCSITNYMHLFFGISEIYLICVFNVSKLHCLLFPLQARHRSRTTGHLLALGVWCVMPIFYLIPAQLLTGRKESFRLTFFRCEGYFTIPGKFTKIFPFLSVVFFILLPMLVVLIAIIWLLQYVRKVQSLQRQSIVTLLLISLCYFCSYLPYGGFFIIRTFFPHEASLRAIRFHYYRFGLYMCYLNFSANPVIYLVSVKSYKEFVMKKWNSVRGQVSEVISMTSCSTSSSSARDKNSSFISNPAHTSAVRTVVSKE